MGNEIGQLGSKVSSNLFLVACGFGNINAVKYLLELNRNLTKSVEVSNNDGLHTAAEQGQMDTVVFLIEKIGMNPAVEGLYCTEKYKASKVE